MNGNDTGKSQSTRFLILIRVGLMVAITVALAWQIARDWESVRELEFRITTGNFLACLAFSIGGLLGLPIAFVLILRRIGLYRPTCHLFYYRLWLQAYFFRYVPTKVVLVAERVRLGNQAGLSPVNSLALLALETLLLTAGAAVLLVALLGFVPGSGGGVVWISLGALVVSLAFLTLLPSVFRLAGRISWLRGWTANLDRVQLPYADQTALIVLYTVIWFSLGAAFFFFCRWFVHLDLDQLAIVVFWFVAAYVTGLLSSITPAGLGVREGVVVLGLASVFEPGQAVALAIAGRIWMTLVEMLCVAAARAIPVPSGGELLGHDTNPTENIVTERRDA
jgi:hypothetical protein